MDHRVLAGFLLCGLGLTSHSPRVYHYVNLTRNWFDAQQYCRLKYTELATIKTDDDARAAKTDQIPGSYAWIGLSDDPGSWREGVKYLYNSWAWTANRIIIGGGYRNWRSGEPNNQNATETCATMFPDGTWADKSCSLQLTYICFDGPHDQVNLENVSYVWVNQTATFAQAASHCSLNHTSLAMIRSPEEQEAVLLLAPQSPAWFGMYRMPWLWPDESGANLGSWRSNQPDNGGGNQFCVNQDHNSKWSDADCSMEYTFLCEGGLKAIKRFIRMKIHTDLDPPDPDVHDWIIQQLNLLLSNQGISDVKLRWNVQEIHQESKQGKEKKKMVSK